MRSMTRQDARRLIDEPNPECPTGLRNRVILRFMYETGLRVSEVPALRCGDVDLQRGTVTAGEGAARRVVPLLAGQLDDLRRWRHQHPGGEWLVPTLKGGQISEDYLRRMVSREAEAAGLDPAEVSPRVLRDTCGVELAAHFTVEEMRQLLGLADRRSAAKYRPFAQPGIAERMKLREQQPRLPEKPEPEELLAELLADPASRRRLAKALITELRDEIGELAGEAKRALAETKRAVAEVEALGLATGTEGQEP